MFEQVECMEIVDSINLRKQSYSNRLKYEEFYQRYEDLCSASLTASFKVLKAQNSDFLELTRQIMKEQLVDLGKELYAFGKSRVFFKDEIKVVLEEARDKALYYKKLAVEYISDAILLKGARVQHGAVLEKIGKLQKFIRRQIKYKAAFSALKLALRMEKVLISYRNEKRKGIEEGVATKIAALIAANSTHRYLTQGLKARKVLSRKLLELSGKSKMRKIVFTLNIVKHVVDRSWETISRNVNQRAAVVLTRVIKGYLARKEYAKEIQRARELG